MRVICGIGLCLMALLAAGCAGYHLGPSNGELAGARTVQLNPFINKTLEPRLGDYLMNSMRKSLQQDGTYRLDTRQDGSIILSAEILEYHRSALSSLPADVISVLDYDITMSAQITARERGTGRVLFDKKVSGRTSLRAGTDLPSAERQALPLLTDDVAKQATDLLVDGTW